MIPGHETGAPSIGPPALIIGGGTSGGHVKKHNLQEW